MTPEEMRVAIAEVYFDSIIARDGMKLYQRPAGTTGYRGSDLSGRWIYERADGSLYGTNWPTAEECRRGNIDEIAARYNFPKDLNAMHEARKTLTFPQQDRMDHELENIGIREGNPFPLSSSSAVKQAEAFCRTLFPERFK